MFTTEMTEKEVINSVRNMVKAHVPESNPWAEPNLLSVFSIVMGGIAWGALQEAKHGIDARVMPDTAVGSALDAIAARPPYNTLRAQATKATGCVDVVFAGVAQISAGDTFTRSDGEQFVALCDTDLGADGSGQVKVEAVSPGPNGNSAFGYPFSDGRGSATVCMDGIGGGFDVECDDDLRDRLYALQPGCFSGTLESYIRSARGVTGVSQANACDGIGGVCIWIAMKGNRLPTQVDVDLVQAVFDDPCKRVIGTCATVKPATGCPLEFSISDKCLEGATEADVQTFMETWVEQNAVLGQEITRTQLLSALDFGFPGIDLGVIYSPIAITIDCLYNSVQVTIA